MVKKTKSAYEQFLEKLTPEQKQKHEENYRELLREELKLSPLQNAFELREDMILSAIAATRDTEDMETVSEEDTWNSV